MARPQRSATKKVVYTADSEEEEGIDEWEEDDNAADDEPPQQVKKNLKRAAKDNDIETKPPKQPRKYELSSDIKDLPPLSIDILSHVMSMLMPQEILAFASLSKAFLQVVSYEHVMQAGLVAQKIDDPSMIITSNYYHNGGRRKITKEKKMDKIMAAIGSRSVYIPTPLRILRLLCGKTCERVGCDKQAQLWPNMLLHVCLDCAASTNLVHVVAQTRDRDQDYRSRNASPALRDFPRYSTSVREFPRAAKEYSLGMQRFYECVLTRPFYDPHMKKRIGPCLTSPEISDMLWNGTTLEEFDASCKDIPDYPTTQAVKQVMETYEQVQKQYTRLDAEIELRETQARQAKELKEERKRIKLANAQVKKEKLERIIPQVQELLDEKWKAFAVQVSYWNFSSPHWNSKAVEKAFQRIVRNPDKVKPELIEDTADRIDEMFHDVYIQRTKLVGVYGWGRKCSFPDDADAEIGSLLAHKLDKRYV